MNIYTFEKGAAKLIETPTLNGDPLHANRSSCFVALSKDLEPYILRLIDAFLYGHTLIVAESALPTSKDFKDYNPGLILSTSGSSGERKWIFHPWTTIKSKIHKATPPEVGSAHFLSLAHAAGIESFLTHFIHQVDSGYYPADLSAAKALEVLQFQKASVIRCTPSTFLRFISYPKLKVWLQENAKKFIFGGEEIGSSLAVVLKNDFPSAIVQSIFGTTESWGLETSTGRDLQWHILKDSEIKFSLEAGMLSIESPYLFTHELQGNQLVPRREGPWITGDHALSENGQWRFRKNQHIKYHGVKVFPQEWEAELCSEFDLPWLKITLEKKLSDEDCFLATVPRSFFKIIEQIKQFALVKKWPPLLWNFLDEPPVTVRGKQTSNVRTICDAGELRSLLSNYRSYGWSLQSAKVDTWREESLFSVTIKEDLLFYLPIDANHTWLEYIAKDEMCLIRELPLCNERVMVKLPITVTLEDSWRPIGKYHHWQLELKHWEMPVTTKEKNGKFLWDLGSEMDHLLMGTEKEILQTLEKNHAVLSETSTGQGLVVFSLINDAYFGNYMVNRGLPFQDFLGLGSLALREAKSRGCQNAFTAVAEDNHLSQLVHEALGFKKKLPPYQIWSNK